MGDVCELDLLTGRVIGCVFEVSNTLGAGFLEKVYRRTLLAELGLRGIRAKGGFRSDADEHGSRR